jgi:hypothetical protein
VKAEDFVSRIEGLESHSTKAYGSYQDLVSDLEVDVIYVGVQQHFLHSKFICLSLHFSYQTGDLPTLTKMGKKQRTSIQ